MNAHSRKLVKPGDVFIHMVTGDVYKLLKVQTLSNARTGNREEVYVFLDVKTEQQTDYTWGMFRDRLKYAPQAAQFLYADKEGEVKTGKENIDEVKT